MLNRLVSTLLVAILASSASTSAYPAVPKAGAARFEPLLRRAASSHVGPARSIDRLRLRRTPVEQVAIASPRIAKRIVNPKVQEAQLRKRSQPVEKAVIVNPKAKRSLNSVVANPKNKRSLPTPPTPFVQRRNRKARRHILRRTVQLLSHSVRQLLGNGIQIGTVRVVPNPKSNNFAAVLSALAPAPSSPTTSPVIISTKDVPIPAPTTSTSLPLAELPTSVPVVTSVLASVTSALLPASSTAAVPSATATTWPSSGGMIAGAYYADWTAGRVPPEAIPYKMFDVLHFSFAVPTTSLGLEWTQWNSEDLLERTIRLAHGNNTKVLITIGGWADSGYFSTAVSTYQNQQTFAQNIYAFVQQYGADGVDIDWEYPGTQGAAGNVVSSSDTANFLSFLQILRGLFGPDLRISTATTQRAFIGANGSPLTDVSAFAQVLDAVMVMNYDVWGASSSPGPNAPLRNDCPNSLQPDANMYSAIQAWEAAGMARNQILIGVPAYGYVSSSSATTLIHKREVGRLPSREVARRRHQEANMSPGHRLFLQAKRRAAKAAAAARARKIAERKAIANKLAKRDTIIFCPNNHSGKPCPGISGQNITEINWYPLGGSAGGNGTFGGVGGVKIGNGDLSGLEGNQIEFYQLVDYGVIQKTGADYVGANGYTRAWDACSTTPYAYSQDRDVVITYDDPTSMFAKGNLAQQQGIAGILVWELTGDTSDYQLAQSWRNAMGLTPLGD